MIKQKYRVLQESWLHPDLAYTLIFWFIILGRNKVVTVSEDSDTREIKRGKKDRKVRQEYGEKKGDKGNSKLMEFLSSFYLSQKLKKNPILGIRHFVLHLDFQGMAAFRRKLAVVGDHLSGKIRFVFALCHQHLLNEPMLTLLTQR